MEDNTCNVNSNLNSDALLPPRKRLLAGLKRQNFDANSPSPSKDDNPICRNPFIAQLSNSNLSNEDIVESSRITAIEAAKVAAVARAKAEEKALKAAKAFSVARNALDLVATLSEEAAKSGKCLKTNKMKKQENVEELYNKNKNKGSAANSRADEDLARNLHRAINSSPRILKNSDTKNHKHKRAKGSGFSGRINSCGEITNNSHGPNGVVGNVGTEGPVKKIDTIMVGLNTSNPRECIQLRLNNGEGGHSGKNGQTKFGDSEAVESLGRKRGRIKQKKLPLSVCSIRDQTGLKEEGNNVGINGDLFSSNNLIPDERTSTSMWKCQSLKVTACVKPTKVMQL